MGYDYEKIQKVLGPIRKLTAKQHRHLIDHGYPCTEDGTPAPFDPESDVSSWLCWMWFTVASQVKPGFEGRISGQRLLKLYPLVPRLDDDPYSDCPPILVIEGTFYRVPDGLGIRHPLRDPEWAT